MSNRPKDAAIPIRINNDSVGDIDSLLQTIPRGVVDQTSTTTKKARDTGICIPINKANVNQLT